MIWEELQRLAIVGLDRSEMSEELKAGLAAEGLPTKGRPAQILGQALAYYNQLNKAAISLPSFHGQLAAPPSGTDKDYCSQIALDYLQEIIHGDYRAALPEFVEALQLSGRQLPPEQLPPLFDECLKNESLWTDVRPMIGEIGEWLLQQNPDWKKLQYSSDLSWWLSPNKDERIALLRYLHQENPQRAIDLLQSTWKKEKAAEKLAFLKVLATSPHTIYENFLLDTKTDGRKEIRLLAATILAAIPHSETAKTLHLIAKKAILFDGKKLLLQLPEDIDSSEELGIIIDMSKGHGYGLRVAWLAMLLERIPPSKWSEEWNLSPSQVVQLFAQDHYHDAWMPALANTALTAKDDDYLLALLLHWRKSSRLPLVTIKNMIKSLSKSSFWQLSKTVVEQAPPLLSEDSLGYLLLLHSPYTWPNEVSTKIINNFQKSISAKQTNYWYKPLIKKGAYSIHSALSTQLSKGWPSHSMAWYDWSIAIETLLTTLEFRKEMLLAVDEE